MIGSRKQPCRSNSVQLPASTPVAPAVQSSLELQARMPPPFALTTLSQNFASGPVVHSPMLLPVSLQSRLSHLFGSGSLPRLPAPLTEQVEGLHGPTFTFAQSLLVVQLMLTAEKHF